MKRTNSAPKKKVIDLQLVFDYEIDNTEEAALLLAEISPFVKERYKSLNAFYGKEAWELYRTLTRQKNVGDVK